MPQMPEDTVKAVSDYFGIAYPFTVAVKISQAEPINYDGPDVTSMSRGSSANGSGPSQKKTVEKTINGNGQTVTVECFNLLEMEKYPGLKLLTEPKPLIIAITKDGHTKRYFNNEAQMTIATRISETATETSETAPRISETATETSETAPRISETRGVIGPAPSAACVLTTGPGGQPIWVC
jgi:hypothetical protein